MLIEVKAKVAEIIDNKVRKKTEVYVTDTEFFAQAEYAVNAMLAQQQEDGTVESFDIQSLKISAIKEIDDQSLDNTLPSFIVTLRDLFHDDEGNEKQLRYKVLLWASDLTQANQRANELSYQGYDMLIEGIKQVDYIYLNNTNTEE